MLVVLLTTGLESLIPNVNILAPDDLISLAIGRGSPSLENPSVNRNTTFCALLLEFFKTLCIM